MIGAWKLSPGAKKNNKLLILVVVKGGMKSYSAKKDIYLLVAETIVLIIKYKKFNVWTR